MNGNLTLWSAILVIKCCIPLLHYIMLLYQVNFHYFQKCTYIKWILEYF